MGRFTSIFHEEVIFIDEFKGEAEASYAAKRNSDKMSHAAGHKNFHPDKVNHEIEKKNSEKLRDKGEGREARSKDEALKRKAYAQADKNTYERDNARRHNASNIRKIKSNANRNYTYSYKKAANESFLPEIEII